MAHESERRWGALEFIGAFATAIRAPVIPAPGAKLSARKAAPRGAVQLADLRNRASSRRSNHSGAGPDDEYRPGAAHEAGNRNQDQAHRFHGRQLQVPGNATPMAEFNFWFDPEAARIVLRSRIPQKIMFGLDICNLAPLRKAEFDQIANAHTPITDLFREDLGNRYPGVPAQPNAIGLSCGIRWRRLT